MLADSVEESRAVIMGQLDPKKDLKEIVKGIKSDLSNIYSIAMQKLGTNDKLTKDLATYLRIVTDSKLFTNSRELIGQIKKPYFKKVDKLLERLKELE